ncbi:trigger factor [Neolewinella xylanilytica]|uniref:Trigger factor n=1 Tax=Neolewinella xylanilytica TaxID=1514080 RepID=A0A2S6I7E7_9BACT|nr:trigger factor [Neolewinella xylanilytica]PPK87424.1 trigger factor [Neolewinella xylanilytica]
MAEVTYEKTGPVTGRIQLFFPKEELSKKLNEELKKESKRVSIKGFRKGKTPMSALRKLMGNQVFGPLLDRTIQEELFGYIQEQDIKLIFSPLPDESEQVDQISATNIKDLRLSYDLGLEPEFELKMPEQTFSKYVLDTNDEFLDELVGNLRKQRGETKEIEAGPIQNEDILDVTIQEVDGELSNDAKLYVDNLEDAVKAQLVGQEKGTTITVEDITAVEKNGSESHARKYLLELGEDNEVSLDDKSFTITVNKISRLEPAELNEEFYTQFDPEGNVTTEEELREKLAFENAKGFDAQGTSMANFEIQRALVEGNDFEVPVELMKKISKNDKDSDFELFERGVRWMLIRNKIAADKEIELQYEDIRAEALENLLRMLGGQRPPFLNDEFLDNYIQNMLKDEKQREELTSNAMEKKVMAAVREDVSLKEEPLNAEGFNEKIKAFNEANTPATEEE